MTPFYITVSKASNILAAGIIGKIPLSREKQTLIAIQKLTDQAPVTMRKVFKARMMAVALYLWSSSGTDLQL